METTTQKIPLYYLCNKKNSNTITSLTNDDGVVYHNHKVIFNISKNYFEFLFSRNSNLNSFDLQHIPQIISKEDNDV